MILKSVSQKVIVLMIVDILWDLSATAEDVMVSNLLGVVGIVNVKKVIIQDVVRLRILSVVDVECGIAKLNHVTMSVPMEDPIFQSARRMA